MSKTRIFEGRIVPLSAAEKAAREKEEQEWLAAAPARADAAAAQTRREAYPPLGDQFDEIWKALDAIAQGQPIPETTKTMIADLKAVKANNPVRGS